MGESLSDGFGLMGYRVWSSPTVSRNGKHLAASLSSCVVGKLGFWKSNTCAAALSVGEIAYSLFECASWKDRSILDNLYLLEKLLLCS